MAGKSVRSRAGLFSRAAAVRAVDGRTREARIVRETITALTAHVGRPSATQSLVIHSCAILVLRLRCALERYATGKGDVESLNRHVIGLVNSLTRSLALLGLERPEQAPLDLASYLELKAEQREAAA